MTDAWETVEAGWYSLKGVGSVRSSESYRLGGWWFLALWLPDCRTNDFGPFKTKRQAMAQGLRLYNAIQETKP